MRWDGAAGLLGGRAANHADKAPFNVAADVTTRAFLLDHERFVQTALPLDAEAGAGSAIAPRLFEETLSAVFRSRGLRRLSRNDDNNWLIHPRRHNANHSRYLTDLIALVEDGATPFRRTGNRWDIRTEGRHFLPWRIAIARHRAVRRFSELRRRSAAVQPVEVAAGAALQASGARAQPELVSVVVPVRNGMPFIEERLKALLKQDYNGAWELIIADNGSTDETVECVRNWANRFQSLSVVDTSDRSGSSYTAKCRSRECEWLAASVL